MRGVRLNVANVPPAMMNANAVRYRIERKGVPMKTLVIIRHGKAEQLQPDHNDLERRLTETASMALAARLPHMLGMLEGRGRTAAIWTSSAVRARQTAELVEQALKHVNVTLTKKVKTRDSLLKQDVDGLLQELAATDAEIVFCVGHAPFVEDLTARLVGMSPHYSAGALSGVTVTDGDEPNSLLWFSQGPDASAWETLACVERVMSEKVEAIKDRRQAFFATPEDIETIHRFRTNARSLRSIIAFIKPWQNKEQNEEAQCLLRDVVRLTSRQRELDVFEEGVRANGDASNALLKFCKKEAARERSKLLKALSSKEVTHDLKRAMDLSLNVEWKPSYASYGLTASEMRERFDAMVESCTAELRCVRLSDYEKTHDVRKRAKRARYVSELLGDVLGADAADIARHMNDHQDDLGAVCDARANINLVNEFLKRDLDKSLAHELKKIKNENQDVLFNILKERRHKK